MMETLLNRVLGNDACEAAVDAIALIGAVAVRDGDGHRRSGGLDLVEGPCDIIDGEGRVVLTDGTVRGAPTKGPSLLGRRRVGRTVCVFGRGNFPRRGDILLPERCNLTGK